jgi:hypothetical protein
VRVRRDRLITGPQIVRLAAEAGTCTRTVERVYDRKGSDYSRANVARAAQVLGLPMPPSPECSDSTEAAQ